MTADHCVYRCFDASGRLLYVGCSGNVTRRLGNHHSKPWWPLVAQVTVSDPMVKDEAYRTETAAIVNEGPVHNIIIRKVHVADPKVARTIVRKRQRGAREIEEANDLIRQAIADGATYGEVGSAIGLDAATVHYIVNGRKR